MRSDGAATLPKQNTTAEFRATVRVKTMTRPQFAKRRQLSPAVGNYPPSITRSWLEMMVARGHSKASAMRDLNEACHSTHRQSRLYEWLQGKQQPPRVARIYMLSYCLSHVLHLHGVPTLTLPDATYDRLAEELS